MIEAAINGFLQVFTWPVFGYMVLGVLIGLVIGILPGVGGTFSLAMLIPFTFRMEPASAFALLLGAHAVGYTGGSITAILLNTPGDPPNAATVFDGFPMTRKGQAGRAIGAALTSSALGGAFGGFVLIALIPIMRPLILSFGPPEFFMVALVGISFIAALSGKSLIKGLISGGVGLLLGFVGMEMSTATERFTFGLLYLWDGVKLVPVILGLFAVAEMIELAISGGSLVERSLVTKVGGALQGLKDTFKRWWLVLRCSVIGTLVGIVPGIGGDVACFLAYGHAKQTERNGPQFGTGVVEGVIAPESANNAKEGGALVPTVAFGIPGSAGMAILLGAFYIQGLTPGPEMLATNLWLIFFMAWIVIIANILAAAICMAFANQVSRIALLPGSLLVPLVLILVGIGAYGPRNSLGDLAVALIFGFVGYVMKKYDWPRAVLIIGLVLARVMEKNLLLSLRLYHETFFLRPITLVLLVLLAISLVISIRQRQAGKEEART